MEGNCIIKTTDEWFENCPPQKGIKQWVPYRSAMEMAKYWTSKKPDGISRLINERLRFGEFDIVIPEYESMFDDYKPGRMHDLLILNRTKDSIITVEGKADESFGTNVYLKELEGAIKEKAQKPSSMKFDRMINLYTKYFLNNSEVFNLMYQLVYWYAGTLCDAKKCRAKNMVMLNQVFKSKKTNDRLLNRNNEEYYRFIELISENSYREIGNEEIIGPINNKYTDGVDLFIAKYVVELP